MIRTKRNPHAKIIGDINITPFTDVCLVLLIIFMVTAPILTKEALSNNNLPLNLPKASTAETTMPASLTVTITRDQQVLLNNVPASFKTLEADMRKYAEQGAEVFVLKADEKLPYSLPIYVLDTARKVGFARIALAASKADMAQPSPTP